MVKEAWAEKVLEDGKLRKEVQDDKIRGEWTQQVLKDVKIK